MDSQQAYVTEGRTQGDALRSITRAENLNIYPVSQVSLANDGWNKILDAKPGIAVRIIKNHGTLPIRILIGKSDPQGFDGYNYILHGGDVLLDGKGEAIDLSFWKGQVWALCFDYAGTAQELGIIEAMGTPN